MHKTYFLKIAFFFLSLKLCILGLGDLFYFFPKIFFYRKLDLRFDLIMVIDN